MGLFGFFKKKQDTKIAYKFNMLFDAPIDGDRDQQIKGLAIRYIGQAGVKVHDVKTTSFYPYGDRADFIGEPGECITVECASTPSMESTSSYAAISVTSEIVSEEEIRKAFAKIRAEVLELGYYFTEF